MVGGTSSGRGSVPGGWDNRAVSDLARDLLAEVLGPRGRLFVVSNRGPVTFDENPEAPLGLTAARGSGGLVTALADLGGHAPVTWIATALTARDRRVGAALRALGGTGPAMTMGPVAPDGLRF